jgi:galactitol-specific phosphotransferase system IIB component
MWHVRDVAICGSALASSMFVQAAWLRFIKQGVPHVCRTVARGGSLQECCGAA